MATSTRKRGMARNRQLNVRTWVQKEGAYPGNQIAYLNKAKGQLRAGGVTVPVAGSNQVNRPSDTEYGDFQPLGRTRTAPDLGTISVEQDLTIDQINWLEEIHMDNLPVAFHLLMGEGAPGNQNAWESKIVIPDADLSSFSYSDMQSADGDEILTIPAEFSYSAIHRAVRVTWNEIESATVTQPVTGAAFGKNRNTMYWIGQGDGSSVVPKFYHTTDGANITALLLTGILSHTGENPTDLVYTGKYIIAPTGANSYIYAHEDSCTTTGGWTEVSTGFVGGATPNAAYALNLARVYFAAENGYIYVMTSIGSGVTVLQDGTLTTEDLNDIDGIGDTVVAVGDANVVLVSQNNGETFSLIVGPIAATVLNTVSVIDDEIWYVGAADGNAYHTTDGGDTWSAAVGFTGAGAGSVTDIYFFKENPAFGLLCHSTATPASRVYRTTDGGNTWENESLTGFPTSDAVNNVAMWDANTMIAGGIADTATDGFVAIAKTARSS